MARANILYGGGDAVDYEELTATAADVPEGLTFLGHNSDGEPETGTLPDMTNMYGSPGYSSSNPNVPIHQAVYEGDTTDTDGNKKIVFKVPHGVYPDPDDNSAYVGCDPGDLGLSADVIANGHETGGIVGTYGSDGNLKASHLLTGEVGYGSNGRVAGSAANRGAVTQTLAAGESYTINEGFFSNGKITAKDLASQTDGDATASDIITGLIAWVKGKKITGTMKKAASSKKTTLTSTDTRAVIQQTKASSGDARVWDVKNADNTERLCILNPVEGFWSASDIIGVAISTVASVIGLTAAKLKKGETVAGLTGTYYGTKACISAAAVKGFGSSSSDWELSETNTFTMPENGTVYYGGYAVDYNGAGSGTCRIYKNNTVMDNRDLTGNAYMWRGTMRNKSFAANKGDVIKVECTVSGGSHVATNIQAVIVY